MSSAPSLNPSPELIVRRLNIDLTSPMRRHWNGDDAFLTAFFNALSFSFPEGEQFFIESVRNAVPHLEATPTNLSLIHI